MNNEYVNVREGKVLISGVIFNDGEDRNITLDKDEIVDNEGIFELIMDIENSKDSRNPFRGNRIDVFMLADDLGIELEEYD